MRRSARCGSHQHQGPARIGDDTPPRAELLALSAALLVSVIFRRRSIALHSRLQIALMETPQKIKKEEPPHRSGVPHSLARVDLLRYRPPFKRKTSRGVIRVSMEVFLSVMVGSISVVTLVLLIALILQIYRDEQPQG